MSTTTKRTFRMPEWIGEYERDEPMLGSMGTGVVEYSGPQSCRDALVLFDFGDSYRTDERGDMYFQTSRMMYGNLYQSHPGHVDTVSWQEGDPAGQVSFTLNDGTEVYTDALLIREIYRELQRNGAYRSTTGIVANREQRVLLRDLNDSSAIEDAMKHIRSTT